MNQSTLSHINQQVMYDLLFQHYPDVVNIPEMCEMLGGISSKTAYKLLQENKISHFKVGRTDKIPKINILLYLNLFSFTFKRSYYDALPH